MMFSARHKRALGAAVAAATAVALTACGPAGNSGGGNSLTVSYSQVVADELPLWIAADSGLFAKHGLDVKLTSVSGSDGFPALVSGQTQLASIGASEMVAGAGSGAQVSYLATLTPVFPYQMYAKVNSGAELRGKKVGITSLSGSIYVATVLALKQFGLTTSDVQLINLGSVTNLNNALVAGSVDAALSHPPASTTIEAAGYHSILDLAKQNIPTSNVGIAALKSYVSGNKDQITKFMAALQEAIAREKSDQQYAISELQKHLQVNDPKALQETWQYYAQETLPDVPTPTVAQLQTSKDALAKTPGVSSLDLASIVDQSFFPPAKS
jgi:NitT/TauT family transport system substrate-binding protein